MEKLNIAGRLIGSGKPPYIIAEIGSNHNGDMQLCKKLIDSAKSCGADAVKFQSWSSSSLICKAEYARNTDYADKKKHFGSLEEMVEQYQFTPEQHHEIEAYCREKDITFLSTCFSVEDVDLLDSLNVPAFKIASMDINHVSLLKYIASKNKTVILSTGMSTLGEIENAVSILQNGGAGPVALLHCLSLYPPSYDAINLRNIHTLQRVFDIPVGFSDHTFGISIPLAAIATGACIIEKHFTLDKNMEGWDHAISADPSELEQIVKEGRNVWKSLGSYKRIVGMDEIAKSHSFRRSIVVKHTMKAGDVITENDLDFKRPGTGIRPDKIQYVIGCKLITDIKDDEILLWKHLKI
ncbi:MAG: N-acetylneuraminate synthase family protein [Bacteroidales bacterium]|nr:N-acetylneuraminate synthase family protein [Bacteroidales bacterium]